MKSLLSAISPTGSELATALGRHPLLLLVPISLLVGGLLVMTGSPLVVGAILAVVPVVALQLAFVRNLMLGVAAYLIVEYLQPGHRVPVLAQLRPGMLVAGALLLAWILNMMQHRTRLVLNWQVKSYGILLLISALSAYSAISIGMVGDVLITLSKTLIVFCIMYSVVDTLPKLRNLIWLYIGLHGILAATAFALFFTTGQRQFGDLGGSFLGDENDSAMAILLMTPYSFFMLGHVRSKPVKALLVVILLSSSAAVLFSFSRGAFMGFMAMVFYVWSKSQRKVVAGLGLLAIIVLLFTVMPGTYWERIESVKNYNTEGSAQGRIDAWKGGLGMMRDSPLFGAGLGNFNRAYGTRYNTINTRWTAAHSLYIQFIGELGVSGLIFLVATIALTFRTFGRVRRACRGRPEREYRLLHAITRGGECGFGAYLVTTFFLNSMVYPHLWHFGAVAGCALLALKDLERRGLDDGLSLVEPASAAATRRDLRRRMSP